uniref:F-box domain-containing protein n=1 Tax=Pithovirus LCPAC403 TaxID=2506596 RepID=A0A481ZC02_9VIRU|nr:MAG: uncharacterized protein LCPAC403_03200 [Pithovirus LCPAC403]
MNSDRYIKELLEVFGVPNLSNLGSDVIVKYFDDISVKEVMKLCRVNRQFNIACQNDSMWRRKVKNDYGIKTKYGKTWKETAQFLFGYNMINLNQTWVNGKTYRELFDESLESKDNNYFKDLRKKYDLLTIIFPSYVEDIETAKLAVLNPDDSLSRWARTSIGQISEEDGDGIYEEINEDYENILQDEDRLKKQAFGMTREFVVVACASAEIRGTFSSNNFGLSSAAVENLAYTDVTSDSIIAEIPIESKIKIKKLAKFIDPNLYILTYSIMSLYSLWVLDVWEWRAY